jgi:hypothetical protein
MSTSIIKTEFGKFNVKYTNGLISIGGSKWCGQVIYRSTDDIELLSLHVRDGGCSLGNTPIRGEQTQKMLYLLFTLLKVRFPDAKTVKLIDTSSIQCTLSDGKTRSMPLMKSSLLLYGKTYYERKFKARPRHTTAAEDLELFRKNYIDPTRKPATFYFNNPDLQELLYPIYEATQTWKEFIDVLHTRYTTTNICKIIYPWVLQAIYAISEKEITTYWEIDIDMLPNIHYTTLQGGIGGGFTRKRSSSSSSKQILHSEYDANDLFHIKY